MSNAFKVVIRWEESTTVMYHTTTHAKAGRRSFARRSNHIHQVPLDAPFLYLCRELTNVQPFSMSGSARSDDMSQSGATSHPQDGTSRRQPRGNYARLICLNCRARKIKCNLPTDIPIDASPLPQPPDRACTRCEQRGLDCIVDKTILGRPAQKRRCPGQPKDEDLALVDDSPDAEPELDPDVQDFVLSDLRDEVHDIGSHIAAPGKTKPSKHEIFESLMDSTHLFAALMSRDSRFGSRIFGSGFDVDMSVDETKLVSDGLAALLDEQ